MGDESVTAAPKRADDADLRRIVTLAQQGDREALEALYLIHFDRIAHALLEKETLDRNELDKLLDDVEPASRSSETVGTVRVVSVE